MLLQLYLTLLTSHALNATLNCLLFTHPYSCYDQFPALLNIHIYQIRCDRSFEQIVLMTFCAPFRNCFMIFVLVNDILNFVLKIEPPFPKTVLINMIMELLLIEVVFVSTWKDSDSALLQRNILNFFK